LDLGFAFTDLSNWIYKLIDYYIAQVERWECINKDKRR
jgi:hypothetical protein